MTRREALQLGLVGGAAGLLLAAPLIGAVADGTAPVAGGPPPAEGVGTPAGEDDLQRRIRLKLGEIDEIKEWHSLQDQIVQANAAKNAEEARRLCQEQQALTERLVAALRRRGDIYWIFVASNWDSMGDHTEAKAFIGDMLAKSQTPTPFELAFIKHYAPELAPDK